MSEKMSWSFTAASSAGSGVSSSGAFDTDATASSTVTLDAAMVSATDLTFQLNEVSRITLLAIVPSLTDGSIEIQADGSSATALTGPMVLFGAAVGLFAGDLTTLRVQNKHVDKKATLSVLMGLKLSA